MDVMIAGIVAALVLAQSSGAGVSTGAPTGGVQVNLQSSASGGQVVVAIFANETDWKKNQNPVRTLKLAPGQVGQIDGLAPGRYGIMAFHDKNSDSRLNTLPIGLPTEPYGFSNNSRGRFGPPNWAAASFEVRSARVSQSIRLR